MAFLLKSARHDTQVVQVVKHVYLAHLLLTAGVISHAYTVHISTATQQCQCAGYVL